MRCTAAIFSSNDEECYEKVSGRWNAVDDANGEITSNDTLLPTIASPRGHTEPAGYVDLAQVQQSILVLTNGVNMIGRVWDGRSGRRAACVE